MIPKEFTDYLRQFGIQPNQVTETDFFQKIKKELQSEEYKKLWNSYMIGTRFKD